MDAQDRLKLELDRLEEIARGDLGESNLVWLAATAWSSTPSPAAAMTRPEEWIEWCSRLTTEMDTIVPGHGVSGLTLFPRRRLRRWVTGWDGSAASEYTYQYLTVRRDGGFVVAIAADRQADEHVFQTKDIALLACLVEACQRLLPSEGTCEARFYDVRAEPTLPDRLNAEVDGRYGLRVAARNGFEVFEDPVSGVSAVDLAGELVGHWGAPAGVVAHHFDPGMARSRPLRG